MHVVVCVSSLTEDALTSLSRQTRRPDEIACANTASYDASSVPVTVVSNPCFDIVTRELRARRLWTLIVRVRTGETFPATFVECIVRSFMTLGSTPLAFTGYAKDGTPIRPTKVCQVLAHPSSHVAMAFCPAFLNMRRFTAKAEATDTLIASAIAKPFLCPSQATVSFTPRLPPPEEFTAKAEDTP